MRISDWSSDVCSSDLEKALRRGSHMLRYATEDDFGLPETAFNSCTFWLIEALHFTGRDAEARALFEEMIARRTRAGLLAEDIDTRSDERRVGYACVITCISRWSACHSKKKQKK